MKDLKFHPVCLAFPEMDPASFARKVADYKKHPGRAGDTAVVLAKDEADGEWKIADGRHHYLACKAAGLEFETVRFTGSPRNLLEFMSARGIDRRHMTASQIAGTIATLGRWEAGGQAPRGAAETQREAADKADIGRNTLQRAEKVAVQAPELLPAMVAGHLDAKTAAEVADLPKAERKKVAESSSPKAAARKALAQAEAPDKPAHPFADLLAQITKLAGAVTKAVKEESEEGKRLHAYMGLCGLLTHDQMGQKGATLIALRGVYAVVNAAGRKKLYTDTAIKGIYDKASGGWVPPLHARRKKGHQNGKPKEKLVSL